MAVRSLKSAAYSDLGAEVVRVRYKVIIIIQHKFCVICVIIYFIRR